MTETPKKKTAAKKATKTTVKPEAKETSKQRSSSFLPFDLPKFDLPKIEVPKFDVPKFDLPKVELPKIELPKVELPKVELPKIDVPAQVTEVAERGRGFVADSVKSARTAAGSVRKNVSETVVLVREAVGV